MQQTEPLAELLQSAAAGESAALRHLVERVYPDLKRLARSLRHARDGRTLNTTALVHECYMRLAPLEGAPQDHAHLTSLAVRIMRQVLVDHERARLALKRGGDAKIEVIAAEHAVDAHEFPNLVDIDSALTCLAGKEPRLAQVFECRYFGGLNDADTALVLGISPRTARRDWDAARAWLARELG